MYAYPPSMPHSYHNYNPMQEGMYNPYGYQGFNTQHAQPPYYPTYAPLQDSTNYNSYEYHGVQTQKQVSQQQATRQEPQQKQNQKTHYRHDPYAVAEQPKHTPSMPPVITESDQLAPIITNLSEYEMYNPMMYPPPAQQAHIQQPTHGYTLHEQFLSAVGHICETACTPRGRSMLQSVLRTRNPEQMDAIYKEIVATEEGVVRLMLDGNACHVVRALIEALEAKAVLAFGSASVMTESMILQLAMTSQHTRRILQALFERFSAEPMCDAIAAVLASHGAYLATTQQGCIALMRVIDNATPAQRNHIHQKLFPSMTTLAMDPFGNYVIQHMVEKGDTALVSDAVVTQFLPHCVGLCCNKFASNVMEKVLYSITPSARKTLLEDLLFANGALNVLMQDSYGNFVVQSTIDSCNNYTEFRRVVDRLRPLIPNSPYGHKIESKLRSKRLTRNSADHQETAAPSSDLTFPSSMHSFENSLSTLNDESFLSR